MASDGSRGRFNSLRARFQLCFVAALVLATGLGTGTRLAYAGGTVSLSISSGTVGQAVTVTGSGFGNSALSVYWDSTSSSILTTVWANKTFTARITIPQATGGNHIVIARDASGNLGQATFTVVPGLGLQASSGTQGSTNTATATGYASGESVAFYWNSTSSLPLGTVTASTRGQASLSFKVPTAGAGPYTVYAVGPGSGQTAAPFNLVPGVTLSGASGGPGSTTTVSGSGFTANQNVSIYWNCSSAPCGGSPLASTTTDGSGGFSGLSVVIPTTVSAGTYPLGALDSASTPTFASKTFTVQPTAISIAPSNGPPGTTVKVTGSGFDAGELVNLYWNCTAGSCSGTPLDSESASATGTFTGSITVPGATNGSFSVGAQGGTSGLFAAAPFTVNPVLTISPTKGNPGTSVTVSGVGYVPGETVSIYGGCKVAPCSGPLLAATSADTAGNISGVSITIPSAGVGTYPIAGQGAAATNPSFAFANFTVTNVAITLNSSSGPVGQTVTVSGTGFANASLSLYWDSTSSGVLKTVWANNTFSTTLAIPQGAGGTHAVIARDTTGNQAQASFTVTPSGVLQSGSAGQGASDVFTAYGFGANETVDLYWNCSNTCGSPTWTGTSNASGTARIGFTVPTVLAGTYTLLATGETSGEQASATLTVVPTLAISPGSGGSGTTATVTGKAYSSGENVNLYWNCVTSCTGTPLASAQADGNGAFTAAVTIPPTTYATYPITGVGSAGSAASTNFKVVPALSIAQVGGPPVNLYGIVGVQPGQAATVSGVSYAPNENVDISWCTGGSVNCTWLATGAADSSGSFTASVTVPSNIPNATYVVKGVGQASSQTATTSITVLPIATVTPNSGPAGSSVTISGQGYGANHWVQIVWDCPIGVSCAGQGTIWIDTNSDATGSFSYTATIPPNSVVTTTPSPGVYWLRVKDHTFPFQTEAWTNFTVQ